MISFKEIAGFEDDRGLSIPVDDEISAYMESVAGCHITTILPEKIRGNHFHMKKKELLIIVKGCKWRLYWDNGNLSQINVQEFSGEKSVIVEIFPGASHAVVNTGYSSMTLIGLSSRPYYPDDPDTYLRQVTP